MKKDDNDIIKSLIKYLETLPKANSEAILLSCKNSAGIKFPSDKKQKSSETP